MNTDITAESFWFRIQPAFVLVAVFILMSIVVSPRAEFPTNDDWAYARIVKNLLDTGELRLSSWVLKEETFQTGASLVFQICWGALFCLPMGFSFTALRISTLVMGLIGVLAFYGILRQYGFRRTTALLGTLTLAANPLYVSLSYTFMTDVPGLTMMLLAAWLYLQGLRRDRIGWLLAGSVFALGAFLIRQTTLVMPIAFALWVLLTCRDIRRPVRKLVAIAAIPVVGVVLYLLCFRLHVVPSRLAEAGVALRHVPLRTFYFMQYLGLFLLPLWAGLTHRIWKRLSNATGLVVFAGWMLAVSGGFLALSSNAARNVVHNMPYIENVFTNLGLGARTLRDTSLLELDGPFQLQPAVWAGVTALGALGAVALGSMITLYLLERPGGLFQLLPRGMDASGRTEYAAPPTPFLAAGALTLVSFLAMDCLFDRYLLAFIPASVLAILLVMRGSRIAVLPVVGVLVIFLAFSLAGVADYMAWNEARWQAGHYAVEELDCPPERVDAGFEWGGWMNYEKLDGVAFREDPELSWWWVRDPKYVVTFNPLPDHRVIERFPYTTPFSRNPQFLLLSKTPAQDTPDE